MPEALRRPRYDRLFAACLAASALGAFGLSFWATSQAPLPPPPAPPRVKEGAIPRVVQSSPPIRQIPLAAPVASGEPLGARDVVTSTERLKSQAIDPNLRQEDRPKVIQSGLLGALGGAQGDAFGPGGLGSGMALAGAMGQGRGSAGVGGLGAKGMGYGGGGTGSGYSQLAPGVRTALNNLRGGSLDEGKFGKTHRAPAPAAPARHPWVETEKDRLSTFAADVDTASYTLARRSLQQDSKPAPETVLSSDTNF